MNELMNIEVLNTFAGLVAAVTIMTQFSKELIKNILPDTYVRLYVFLIAVVLTFVFAKTGTGMEGILHTLVNSIIVTMASLGTYEALADPKAEKSK